MNDYRNFQVETDPNGILWATLNVPERPLNVFEDSVLQELASIVEHVQTTASSLKFVVFRSGKPAGFLAGADIHRLESLNTEKEANWIIQQGQNLFQKIENLPVPTLAVIHGACVGGGLEFVLSCTHRLATADAKLGLPEVKLGVLPGWGGTQRLPRTVGVMQALPMILEGKLVSGDKARRIGLVDGLISSENAQSEVEEFIKKRLNGVPVSRPNRTWLQWAIDRTPVGRKFAIEQARKQSAKLAKQYPAIPKILDSISAGMNSSTVTDEGLRVERKEFVDLLLGPVSKNLIGIFLMQEKAKKASTWTNQSEGTTVKKIAVIGAGTMGSGIAQQAISRGYDVVLQDVKQEFVDKGVSNIRGLFENAVRKKALSQKEADESLARLHPRVDWADSQDVDLMIEAVVEKMEIKQSILKTADEKLPAHAVLASNTSALPIDEMGSATNRPQQVAGLHFFNPVHKMQLVEVVRTPTTNDETIATLVDVSRKLGKVPVVVKQSPGFLVNRILFPYLDEAARLITEGHAPADIDKAAKQFGMPMGPVELLDVVGIDVARDVSGTLSPLSQQETPAPELFRKMAEQGHLGQKSGKGFYNWENGKKAGAATIPDLVIKPVEASLSDWSVGGQTFNEIQQRLILSMINESSKCLSEGIVEEAWMIDLGMVLGTGFAPFRGGPMKCIETWGADQVRRRLELLASKLGKRFSPGGTFVAIQQPSS